MYTFGIELQVKVLACENTRVGSEWKFNMNLVVLHKLPVGSVMSLIMKCI